jgi:AraC-like DNA-binding protein
MYLRRRPHPSLAPHVDYYWHASGAPTHEKVQIVPSGTLEIVINLREDETRICDRSDPDEITRYSGAVISGAQSGHFVVNVQAHASIIGIHFRPGGAFALLGAPPGVLADAHANLETVWGARAVELRERLCNAGDIAQRFQILDSELRRRLSSAAKLRDEVSFALRKLLRTNARVERVARDVELSHRRLIEIFAAEVGTSPKVFGRIGRFQRALGQAQRQASLDWPQLALSCGYFDQPHLIREFVLLSGLSPMELLARSAVVEGHHAALARSRGSNLSNTRTKSVATLER